MEFHPRYPQPFTLAQATLLDVAVIFEEIARLQNSLARLKKTQQELAAYSETESDPEVLLAFEENLTVIGSQEERVRILNFALKEKGVIGEHETASQESKGVNGVSESTTRTDEPEHSTGDENDTGDGVYL